MRRTSLTAEDFGAATNEPLVFPSGGIYADAVSESAPGKWERYNETVEHINNL